MRSALRVTLCFLLWTQFVIAQDGVISISLQNDIFNLLNQTDRYFTNGVELEVGHSSFNSLLINQILIGRKTNARQLSGFHFQQNIYTPIDIYTEALQLGDRPYASTALLSFTRNSASKKEHYRITSSIGIGLIGKNSGGQTLQNLVHSLSPYSDNANGWHNQISHDVLLDYNVDIEKGVINLDGLQLSALGKAQTGTLLSQVSSGLGLSFGWFDSYFNHPRLVRSNTDFIMRVFGQARLQYVFYDATLQGGVFNSSSTYTIPSNLVNNQRFTYDFGIHLGYKRVQLETGRTWQSAEFVGANNHAWGYFKLIWIIK